MGIDQTDGRLKVAVVSEFFPSPLDPTLGIWVLKQSQAVAELGIDVHVLAMRRPVPPARAIKPLLRAKPDFSILKDWTRGYRQIEKSTIVEDIQSTRVTFIAPPRNISYGSWGLWAKLPIAHALEHLDRDWGIDLVHAHYAAPAGYAASSWCVRKKKPLVTSLHGGDLLNTAKRSALGQRLVSEAITRSEAVLCNSEQTMQLAKKLSGAERGFQVVHLGTDIPRAKPVKIDMPTVVTVANLDPRKRHEDVLRAISSISDRFPELRYLVIGDGPEVHRLKELAGELGLGDRVEFTGRLEHDKAMQTARRAHLFVMPSVDEAFGVAYIEAMAAGIPVIGCRGEGGPEEIKKTGEGILLVPPRDPSSLATEISRVMSDKKRYEELSAAAQKTVERSFSWKRCGEQTSAIYHEVINGEASEGAGL